VTRFLDCKPVNGESMDDDITSDAIDISSLSGFAWQHVWTDATDATGTLRTQASINGTDWEDIDTEAIADGAGTKIVNVTGAHYKYTRAFWDDTSGSGAVLNSWLFGKEG
jgi:hypothetical protein